MSSMYRTDTFLTDYGVLVVDPNQASRSIIVPLIEDLKPERLMIAKTLTEARSAMSGRVDSFDIVIAAVVNPPASGFHFLQEIRTGGIPRSPRGTKVILLSPPPNRTMINLAGALDADGLLAIPVTVASVTNALKAAISREREIQDATTYAKVKLPSPAKKKEEEKKTESRKPKAAVVLTQKDKEKAELIRSLETTVQDAKKSAPAVEPARIDNIRSFWLKDLVPGMILAEDIKGENDELLLATGTPLNEALIEKIKKFSEFGLCRSFLKAGSKPAPN